ncbi:hypothetical protein EJ02DRAFT_447775 [Clathrospora elynae]|uniref:Uncharacterized protein n=1 Tax=Clathrospora elynae TaxID=706981 RepID=A0A6A5SEH6_9PLEO|nr:hypothetical protein EJ02DRAFT_447775 [Clathrospora elynae]
MGNCPYAVALETIDTSLWGVPATKDASEAHATTWVAKTIHDYHLAMVWDNHLFDDYLGDFEGWTKELFLKVERGVYTGSNRARIANSLYNMIATENALEWDPAEFQSMDFDSRSKAYKQQQNAPRIDYVPEQQPPQPAPLAGTQPPQLQLQQPQQPQQDLQQGEQRGAGEDIQGRFQNHGHQNADSQQPPHVSSLFEGPQPQQQWEQHVPSRSWHLQPQPQPQPQLQARPPATAYCKVTPFPQQPTSGVPFRPPALPHNPYKTLPPRWSRNNRLNASTITQFSKLWDNSNKYTGNAYDLLDDKIKIFFSICWQVNIKEEEFHAVFPRILTRRAEMFYIQVMERDDSFASAYTAIKNHFDHDVHHQHYYTDWTTTTFARTRAENPDKGLHEVLQILLDKLQLCQRALGKNFEGEDALRTTVINACRGVPELKMALFKPATICKGLFSDL